MALPPTIPTSFVPRQTSTPRRFRMDFVGAFGLLAYLCLAVTLIAAGGLFFYSRILLASKDSKDAELRKAEESINATTAEDFVRLSNRLTAGQTLLANHIALSNFFVTLQTILPSTVNLSSLRISYIDSKDIKLEGAGVAKNFNALAVTADSFAKNGKIENAIFSHIVINKDKSVSFSLTATLEQSLVTFSSRSRVMAAPVSVQTASTTASTTPEL